MHGLSLVAASRGSSLVAVRGLLIVVASLVAEHGLQGVWAQYLWHTGLVALQHVESSWARDQTRVPRIGRQIPIQRTTKAVPILLL